MKFKKNRIKFFELLQRVNQISIILLVLFSVDAPATAGENLVQEIRDYLAANSLPIKCGFPVMALFVQSDQPELHRGVRIYQEDSREELTQTYHSSQGRFIIHYTDQGDNAIPTYDRNGDGTPDYLEFAGESFERAWQIEIDSLGFKAPPDSTGAPRQNYHVYCWRVRQAGQSVYGQTTLDHQIPNQPYLRYATNIDINVNFNFVSYPGITDSVVRDSMAIAVTAAHEFNHALQSGYRLWPDNGFFHDLWFIESSATYMEEVVADEVNDYLQYLPGFFRHSDRSFDKSASGFIDYGKVILYVMLGKLYGTDITRQVWEHIQWERARPALETVLENHGTELLTEISRLANWMYYSQSEPSSPDFFPDAPFFPDLTFRVANPVQLVSPELLVDSLPRFSFRWYQSEMQTDKPLRFLLEALGATSAQQLALIMVDPRTRLSALVGAEEPIDMESPELNDSLLYSIINGANDKLDGAPFRILMRPRQAVRLNVVKVYPQPFRLSSKQPYLKFENLPHISEIHIFSGNGRHIKTLKNMSNSGIVTWNLVNKFGDKVGTGVYLFKLISEEQDYLGKFVIIR